MGDFWKFDSLQSMVKVALNVDLTYNIDLTRRIRDYEHKIFYILSNFYIKLNDVKFAKFERFGRNIFLFS